MSLLSGSLGKEAHPRAAHNGIFSQWGYVTMISVYKNQIFTEFSLYQMFLWGHDRLYLGT